MECDELCFKSKNLYNAANYLVRQHFTITGHYLDKYATQTYLQDFDPNYTALPAKVSQQTLRLLDKNWKSFFAATKSYKRNPGKFNGRPKLPGYKDPLSGRFPVVYDAQAISKNLRLSKTEIIVPTRKKNIKQVRIIPGNQQYVIEVVYEQRRKKAKLNKSKVAAVDLGLGNLATITSTSFDPLIINGKPLKSINQYYNKKKAALHSYLPKNTFNSNRITRLTNKRNSKIDNYLHNASRCIVDLCSTNEVGTIVIGYNSGWKDKINLGKVTNQNFVNIPYRKLIDQIVYKADLLGMKVKVREESYTSKCSLLDNEPIRKHAKYLGKRVHRGLFKSSTGKLINADVNGSGNILRKAFPKVQAEGIQGLAVSPLRVTPYQLAS